MEIFCETVKKMEKSRCKREHATYFQTPRKYKSLQEIDSARKWAEAINKRAWQIDLNAIRKSAEQYPECLAEMGGEEVGVELTELVDRNAIDKRPGNPRYQGPDQFLREFPDPPLSKWPLSKFERRLREIVKRKDMQAWYRNNRSLFLLVATDEPWLDEETLSEYLDCIELQRPQNIDDVYVMGSYMPDGNGHGHNPVFEVSLAE